MGVILGIDPALHHTGWGVISYSSNQLHHIASGCITTRSADKLEQKLLLIYAEIQCLITVYKPEQAAIEETYVNNNPRTSLVLGQARGAILIAIAQAGIPLACYPAATIKKVVTGSGRADKEQIHHMLRLLMPLALPQTNDAADALAIALCHAYSRHLSLV